MTNILCHLNNESFTTKPTDIKFMGKLRDKMIQKSWSYVDEETFFDKIASTGHAWYGCLFNGHDLMETGKQRDCWRAQSIVAVDIDKCTVDPQSMCKFYADLGLIPWAAYTTFSDDPDGSRSYRVLWRVEVDHKVTYEQWAEVIKSLSIVSGHGDKHARDCSRMWQGGWNGLSWHIPGLMWTYNDLADKMGLL